jgi:hypothetical protein
MELGGGSVDLTRFFQIVQQRSKLIVFLSHLCDVPASPAMVEGGGDWGD